MVETANYNQAAYYHIAKLRLAYLAGDVTAALAPLGDRVPVAAVVRRTGRTGRAHRPRRARAARWSPRRSGSPRRDHRQASARSWRSSRRGPRPARRTSRTRQPRPRRARGGRWETTRAADACFQTRAGRQSAEGFQQWAALACERRGQAARVASERQRRSIRGRRRHYRDVGCSGEGGRDGALAGADRSGR